MPIPAPPPGFTVDDPDVETNVDLPPLPRGFTLDPPSRTARPRTNLPANIPPPPSGFVIDDVQPSDSAMPDVPAPPPGFTIDPPDEEIPPPPAGFVIDQPMNATPATQTPVGRELPRIRAAEAMLPPLGPELPNENDDNRLYQLAAGIEPIAPYDPTDGTVKIPQGPPAPTSAMPAGYVPFSLRPGNDLATAAETVRANNWVANLPAIPDGLPEVQDAAIAARNKYLASNPPPQFKTAKAQQILAAGLRGATRMGETRGYAGEMAGNVIPKAKAAGARALAGLMDFGANNLPEGDIYGTPVPGPPKPAVPKGPLPESEKLRQIAREADASQLPPGTTGARIFDTAQDATINTAPTIVAGVVGGPPAAAAVAAGQAMGTTYDRVYTRLKEKGYADEEAVRLASIAGLGSGGIAGATGGVVGSNPVSKNITGRLIERAAEGAAFGAAQAAGDETLAAAATGDKADFARVPTDAGVGGAISFGMGLLAEMFSRGKARHHRPAREQLERQIKAAKTPADVERAIDDARAVTESIEEALDVVDAPAPAVKPPTAPRQPTPQEQSLARDLHEVAGENRDVEALRAREQERQRRAQQERRYTEQELPALREADQRDASLAEDQRLVDEENALVARTDAHRRERQARAIAYTPDDLLKLDNRQIKQVADDLGVHFDTRGLSMARVMDAQRRAGLENLTSTDLYRRVKELGLKAGTRQKNIGLLLDYREPIPAQKSGPVPSASTGGSALKDQSPPGVSVARADQTVARDAVPVKPRPSRTPFSRAAVEQKLLDYHEETGGGYTADDDAALQRHGGGDPFTFFQKLPGEIKRHIENNPASRRLFKVTDYRPRAGGEDSMHELGDRYWQIVDNVAGSRVKAAKETARRTNDPAIQFWNAVHDNMPPMRDRSAQNAVDPKTLQPGQEFELHGSKFQVLEDADGFRLLRDGDDYPETPLEAFAEGEKIPVDRGTLRQSPEPDLPDDPFAGVRDEPSPTPQPGGGQLRAEPAPVAQPTRPEPGAIVHFTDHKGQPAVGRVEGRNFGHEGGYFVQQGTAGPRTVVQSGNMRAVEPGEYKVGDAVRLRGYRGVSEITEYDPSTGQGYVVDETSRRLRFSYDQVLPTEQKPAAKPSFFDADQAGVSGERPGLFGQPTFEGATGNKQSGLFHTPTEATPIAGESIRASKSAIDPRNTPSMFPVESLTPTGKAADAGSVATFTPDQLAARKAFVAETMGTVPGYRSKLIDIAAGSTTLDAAMSAVQKLPGWNQSPSLRKTATAVMEKFYASVPPHLESGYNPGRVNERIASQQTPPTDPAFGSDAARPGGTDGRSASKPQFAPSGEADPGRRGSADRPPLQRRNYLSTAVAEAIPGSRAEHTADGGLLITLPHGRQVPTRAGSPEEMKARWLSNRPNAVDSLLAHDAGNSFRATDGREFTVPETRQAWDALTAAEQDYILNQFTSEGAYTGDEIVLHERLGNAGTIREEMLHSVWYEDLADAERDVLRGEFGSDEAAVVAFMKLPRSRQAGGQSTPGMTILQSIADGSYFDQLPRSSGRSTRNPMRPRGAVPARPFTDVADVALAAAKIPKGLFDVWSRPLIDNVDAQGGNFGKQLAGAMRRSNDRTRDILGELHAPAKAYLDVVGGAPGKNVFARRSAVEELQRRVLPARGSDYAFSLGQLAVEGRYPLASLSPEAQRIVQLRRELTQKIGDIAVRQGVQVVDPNTGNVRPFTPAKDGQRWIRAFTPEFHTIARLPDGNQLKQALATAIADANGIAKPLALGHINDMADGPLFKRNATETVRQLENFPAFIKHPETGRWVEVLNVDPFSSGKAMVDNAARRLGYLSTFGQDLPTRSVSSDLVEQFSQAGGREKDVKDAIRALNGVPLDHLDLGRFQPEPGTAGYDAVRAVGTVYGLSKSAALTTAAIPNLLEPFTKTLAFAGLRPWAKALITIARHPIASREMTAAIGARTVDQMNWMTRPGHRVGDVVRGVSQILTAPLKFVNEWNELHAAQTGVELARRIRAGKSPDGSRATLRVLDFSEPQIQAMVTGRARPEDYRAIATRFAERTQGSTSTPSERSRAANNPMWQIAVPFDSWAQMTANRTAKVISTYSQAIKSRSPKRIAHATKLTAAHVFGGAAAGAGAAFIYAWLNSGWEGVKIKAHEAADEKSGFAIDSLLNAFLGGAAGRLLNSVSNPRSASTAEIFESVSYPGMMLHDAVDAFRGFGRYKDQTPAERAGGFLRNRFAINRAVTNVMAAWGLTEWNKDQEIAISAYYRWRRTQPDLDQQLGGEYLPAPERLEFRRKMREFMSSMKAGNEPAAQKAVGEAVKLSKTGAKGVASSLRPRKLLGDLEDAQRDRLRRHVGDDAFRRLEAYDDLIESWAASMRFETPTNEGVHARHGANLAKLNRERDAFDKEFEPVRPLITGKPFLDADVWDAHPGLQDRKKSLDAKLSKLENIRRALHNDPKTPMRFQGMSVEELDAEMRAVFSE